MAITPAPDSYPHIVKIPDYCGGKASIDATRVRVNNVVFLHKAGFSDIQILERYPDLNRGQVHAALTYYYDHQAEIEDELAEDEGWDEYYERAKAEFLARKANLPQDPSASLLHADGSVSHLLRRSQVLATPY